MSRAPSLSSTANFTVGRTFSNCGARSMSLQTFEAWVVEDHDGRLFDRPVHSLGLTICPWGDMAFYPMRKHDIADRAARRHLYEKMLEFWRR